jgi:hypothetical protein
MTCPKLWVYGPTISIVYVQTKLTAPTKEN